MTQLYHKAASTFWLFNPVANFAWKNSYPNMDELI